MIVTIISLSLAGIIALAGLILLVCAARFVRSHPSSGLILFGTQLTLLAEYPNSFPLGRFAGVSVQFADLLSVVLVLAAVPILRCWIADHQVKLLVALALLLLLNLVRGMIAFSPSSAYVESRSIVWAIAALLWCSTLQWHHYDWLRTACKVGVAIGVALSIAAFVHFQRNGFGAAGDQVLGADGEPLDQRVLTSGQALGLLLCLAATVWLASNLHRTWLYAIAFLFGVVILASEQRTVWVVCVACFLIYVLLSRRRGPAVLALVGICLVVAVVLSTSVLDRYVALLASSAENTKTAVARQEGWAALLAQLFASGPFSVLFGLPFGSGYLRRQSGTVVGYSPHNWYVNLWLRAGLVGLASYFALATSIALRLFRVPGRDMISTLAVAAVLIYGWSYSINWFGALILGVAIARASSGGAELPVVPSSVAVLKTPLHRE